MVVNSRSRSFCLQASNALLLCFHVCYGCKGESVIFAQLYSVSSFLLILFVMQVIKSMEMSSPDLQDLFQSDYQRILNVECIKKSHEFGEIECLMRYERISMCNALNLYRVFTVSVPFVITSAYVLEKFYCKTSLGAKKIVQIGAGALLYTAGFLYLFENYVNNNDATRCIVSWGIVAGNVAIGEFIKRGQ
jgi:hypothetical protein